MQIVINLPDTNITEDIIRAAKWEDGSLFDIILRGAMRDAIILPKGHGRLIDADYKVSSDGRTVNSVCGYIAPTIIEADRSEEE